MNFGESIFTTQKLFVVFVVYFIVRVLAAGKNANLPGRFAQMSLYLTFALCVYVTFEIFRVSSADGYSNQALYNVSGAMGNKSLLSEFLLLLIPFNLIGLSNTTLKKYFLAAIAYQIFLILLLQTRTVYFVLFIGGLIYISYWIAHSNEFRSMFVKRIVPLSLIVIVLLTGVLHLTGFLPSLTKRLDFTAWSKSDTALERRFIWYKTNQIINENWMKGVGSGNWKIVFPNKGIEGAWRFQEKDVVVTRVHNDFLEVFAETGILGISSFLSLFILPLLLGARLLRKEGIGNNMALFILMIGLFCYGLISIFDFPKERIEHTTVWAIYLGLITSMIMRHRGKKAGKDPFYFHLMYFAMLFLLGYNVIAGTLRFNGEYHARKTIEAKLSQAWDTVLREAKLAETAYYSVDATCVPIKWYSGLAKFNTNDIAGAKMDFEEAYRYNPYNFHVINNLGTCYAREENFDTAIDFFKEAIRINPKFEDSKYNLAFSLYQIGKYQEALSWAEQTKEGEKKTLFIQTIMEKLQ